MVAVSAVMVSGMGIDASGNDDGSGGRRGCAYGEPFGVAAETTPERTAFCCGDGGVAFAGHRLELRGVVRLILFCRDELRLARAAILDVIVEGL